MEVTLATLDPLPFCMSFKISLSQGACMAQLVNCLTLDFCSSHDLTVRELEPHIELYANSSEPASDSLSLTLSQSLSLPPPTHALSLSLSLSRSALTLCLSN